MTIRSAGELVTNGNYLHREGKLLIFSVRDHAAEGWRVKWRFAPPGSGNLKSRSLGAASNESIGSLEHLPEAFEGDGAGEIVALEVLAAHVGQGVVLGIRLDAFH